MLFFNAASLESRIWLYSESAGRCARELLKYVLNQHAASPYKDADNIDELRRSYISICKKDLIELKEKD